MGFFGMNRQDELGQLQAEQVVILEKYNRKLAQYSQSMKNYDRQITKMQDMLEEYEVREHNFQMSSVQTALDLKYLKEQGDQFQEQLKILAEGQVKLIRKQTDNMQSSLEDLVDQQKAVTERMGQMERKAASSRRLLGLTAFMGFLSMCGIAFMVLYTLEIIVF